MAEEKDYYKILGVERTASADEIKRAYDILRDPEKRKRYDQFGAEGVNGAGGFGGGFNAESMDINDIFRHFSDIFGGGFSGGFGGFGGGSAEPRQFKGSDMRMKVKLTLDEITNGVVKKFKVRKSVTCPECGGSGCEKGHTSETCDQCHGQGYVLRTQRSMFGMMQTQVPCPKCHGEGTIIKNPCAKCHGEGIVQGEEIVEIKIPAGVAEGMVVNVPGKGNAAKHNGVAGDIQVIIEEIPHPDLIRDEQDLIYNLLLSLPQAILGDTVEIPTVGGKARIKIAPGTQPGTALRLRGKGIPAVPGYGYGCGDLVVNNSVYIPENLTDTEKKAIEGMKDSESVKPSSKIKDKIFKAFRNYFNN